MSVQKSLKKLMPRFFLPQPSRLRGNASPKNIHADTPIYIVFTEYPSRTKVIVSNRFRIQFPPKYLSHPPNPYITSPKRATMLRRPPTAITLTTEDIAIYEDARTREALQREQLALQTKSQQQQSTPQKNQNLRDPNDSRQDRARVAQVKTREERLGLGAASSSRG